MKGLRWSHIPAALKVLRSTQQWGQDFTFSPGDAWCLPGSSAASCRFHQVTIRKVLPRSQLHSQHVSGMESRGARLLGVGAAVVTVVPALESWPELPA